jgi:hypothetical protein
MHAFFHIRTVIIPQPISITHRLVCVRVCVKLIFLNPLRRFVYNRNFVCGIIPDVMAVSEE